MSDTNELIVTPAVPVTPAIIKAIGVGGGGGNAVGQMYRDEIEGVRCLVCNTDAKALSDTPVPDRLQLGPGLGAGGRPEEGRKLAEDSVEEIREMLDADTKMVFVTAGMGGGTGTGASPVIAREARGKGILTVGIVTIPFLFERDRQIKKALAGLDALAAEVDALLVINNQRLLEVYPETSVIEAFRLADRTLSMAVSSITDIISMHGRVNLDFRDVDMVLRGGGVSVMSTGYGEGAGRIGKAIADALNSPLLNNKDIYRSARMLLALSFDPDENGMMTDELNELSDFMDRFDDEDMQFKWGLAYDRSLGGKVKVTILASGFSLYARKDERAAQPLDEEEQLRYEERRNSFYAVKSSGKKSAAARAYVFSPDDLLNEDLIAEVERVPTKTRGAEQLARIKSYASKTERRTQSPAACPAAVRSGDTISFGAE